MFKVTRILALLIAIVTTNVFGGTCYRPSEIPDHPENVVNPDNLGNGQFTHVEDRLSLRGGQGKLLRDKLAWISESFLPTELCVQFFTPKDVFNKDMETYVIFGRHNSNIPAFDTMISIVHLYNRPAVSRIEIAAYMGRQDMKRKDYPGYDLRHPAKASPIGDDIPGHPFANGQRNLIFAVSTSFNKDEWKQGQIHQQINMHGDVINYRLLRRRTFWGFFGVGGGIDEWVWKNEGPSAQGQEPGSESHRKETRRI